MVYVQRNKNGNISAIYEEKIEDGEEMDLSHPEILEFLSRCDREEKWKLVQSDLKLIRVLEDLVDVLISKNIITITDFPQPVIDKLLARQSIRKRLTGSIGMEYDNEL